MQIAQERVEVVRQPNNTQQARVTNQYIEYVALPQNTQFARVTNMYIEVAYLSSTSGSIWNPYVMG